MGWRSFLGQLRGLRAAAFHRGYRLLAIDGTRFNPLAAAFGWQGKGELTLARRIC